MMYLNDMNSPTYSIHTHCQSHKSTRKPKSIMEYG